MDILQLLTQTVLETCVHRLLFESLLIILIVFLLFSKRSKKITLTEKEKIDLIKEYNPEPLVPKTSDNHPLLVRMEQKRASLKVGKYILINGQKCLNMATWNFLGLLGNKSMEAEANPKKAKCTRKYITVEAIYANIGDICPLPKIIRLRNKYKARIILDESISLGVLGKTGRGLTEHFGLTLDAVDIMSASLENSFASVGGISMGKSWIMWHQRMGSLGYAFSASQPPLCVATAIQAINILEQDTSLVEKCQNACIDCHVKLTGIDGLVLNGLSLSPVKHLRLAEPSDDRQENVDKLQKIVDFAQKEGIALTMANYLSNLEHILPEPSIRIAVNSSLLTEDIDKVASVIKQGTKEILFARYVFS
ncbi:SPT [Acanthosepion pharaonis]|uniref:SPT n=1 Tax=Acanthosepion pharaonis TaxID=158019 RepID=A0A812DC47_ACAPH|nr:SPT [Sepia pharaonis]